MGMSRSEAGRLGYVRAEARIKQATQERLDLYNSDPKRCRRCQAAIPHRSRYNDFCNHSCAAVWVNSQVRNYTRTVKRCLVCGSRHRKQGDLCRWHQRDADIEAGRVSDRKTLKDYLVRRRGHRCELCGGEGWLGQPMPLELDHVNGNAADNRPEVIRLLCPNCHALTPTAKGKNRGNGRAALGIARN